MEWIVKKDLVKVLDGWWVGQIQTPKFIFNQIYLIVIKYTLLNEVMR